MNVPDSSPPVYDKRIFFVLLSLRGLERRQTSGSTLPTPAHKRRLPFIAAPISGTKSKAVNNTVIFLCILHFVRYLFSHKHVSSLFLATVVRHCHKKVE
jgi:hypothetical protein